MAGLREIPVRLDDTRDVAENEDDARKALEDAMGQLKSNGIGTVGPSLVVTKDDLEFIKLEQKQPQDQR